MLFHTLGFILNFLIWRMEASPIAPLVSTALNVLAPHGTIFYRVLVPRGAVRVVSKNTSSIRAARDGFRVLRLVEGVDHPVHRQRRAAADRPPGHGEVLHHAGVARSLSSLPQQGEGTTAVWPASSISSSLRPSASRRPEVLQVRFVVARPWKSLPCR